ncbi:MAG: 50S ribosomal protein L29 [Phycisphaerae bacterium]|nr:50S ribosomal protein L29 [Phycisphaerae bacterium]
MKATEIREMRPDEWQGELENFERQLFDLRTRAVTEKLENTHLLRNIKRDIARLKTVIRESQSVRQAQDRLKGKK